MADTAAQQQSKIYLNLMAIFRDVARARYEMEYGNVVIGNLLDTDIKSVPQNGINEARRRVGWSYTALGDVKDALCKLHTRLEETDFNGRLPTGMSDLNVFGNYCAEAGLHNNTAAWGMVTDNFRCGGYYAVIDLLVENINALMKETNELFGATFMNSWNGSPAYVRTVVQKNLAGNFQKEIYRLYAGWDDFVQIFMAVSIITSECFYQVNGKGSILDDKSQSDSAA